MCSLTTCHISTRRNKIKTSCLRFFIFPPLFQLQEQASVLLDFLFPLSVLFISGLGANNYMVNRNACVLVLCHSRHSKNISCLDAQASDRHHQSVPDSFRQSPSNSQTFNHSAVRSHHAQPETVPDTICQLSFATAFLSMLLVLGWTLSFVLSSGTTVKAAPFVMPKFLRGLALFQKALCHTKKHKVSESMKEQITDSLHRL